jgi:hypothetical protein
MTDDSIIPKNIKIASGFRDLPVQNLGEGISSGFSWIGMKGKNWTLRHEGEEYPFVRPDDGTPSPFLDCVILAMNPHISKLYYSGAYNEDATGAPICASVDGIKPDAGVAEPQSKSCGICPHNVWGSALNGGRGKACQDHRKLAILIMPEMVKNILAKPLLTPVYLKIPPGSFRSLKGYADALVHRGIPYEAVVTRISFNPKSLFELQFQLKQPLTNDEAPFIKQLITAPQTQNLLGSMVEIEQAPPELPPETPGESGLLAAFGQRDDEEDDTPAPAPAPVPQKKKIGRPAGVPNKPKGINQPRLVAPPPRQEPEPADEEGASTPNDDETFVEGSDELDTNISKLLSQQIKGMLK